MATPSSLHSCGWAAPSIRLSGAEGFGANTPGGRGGKVLLITKVEDYKSGSDAQPIPGSLRVAVETEGLRIIVFRVSGVIDLKAPLEI